MARGAVGVSAKQGTGPAVTMSPGKGVKTGTFKPDVSSSKAMSAPQSQANSQRTTTAPAVKMPGVTLVRDTKGRTAREQAVDAYNRENPAHSGGNQQKTMLEREKAEFATASGSGSRSTMPGRPKQAQ